ncbi:Mu transposase C-terminal domain-containing protein [Pseudoduganella namucuonensis]|uniref:Mu transposase C-terminal domain-containing protein n=1 Tax=Pseudoduganella namucuonensis TaxID=1035707 RepID=UPI000B8915D1|nr:Mu transposase C-terminal domain-containing protein [Pseudoduganella namucuonensis]
MLARGTDAELARLPMLEADLASGRARVLAEDPYVVAMNQELLPQKHLQLRARAWNIVRELVALEPAIYEPRRRGQLVLECMRRHGVSHPTVYRYLRRYWQRGQTPNALLPDYSNSGGRGKIRAVSEGVQRGRPRKAGTPPGVNVDEAMRRVFRVAATRHAATSLPFQRRTAYSQMLRDFFTERRVDPATQRVQRMEPVDGLPTFGQFNYWLDQDRTLAAPRPAPPLDAATMVARPGRPGTAFRLEAAQPDVRLVSRADRAQVIGRPVVYVATDVFSGMAAGVYVGMEAPCWPHALLALANAAADKRRYCLRFGRDIAPELWPVQHLPNLLFADAALAAGADDEALLNNFNVRSLVTPAPQIPAAGEALACDASVAHAAPWRAQLARRFDLLQQPAPTPTPGGCGRLDAVLDLEQFTRLVIDSLLHYNHERQADGCTPKQLWDWGLAQRGSALKQQAEDLVRCCLLPVDEATVTADGICLNGLYYSCARAEQEQWFERARQRGQWPVKVAVDASSLDMVYLLDPHAPMHFHACHLTEESSAHRRLSAAEVCHLPVATLVAPHQPQLPATHFGLMVAALAS